MANYIKAKQKIILFNSTLQKNVQLERLGYFTYHEFIFSYSPTIFPLLKMHFLFTVLC